MPYQIGELSKIYAEVRQPYLTQGGRDDTLDYWRDLRHRRHNAWMPEELDKSMAQAARYYDSLPEYVVNKIAQRLRVNKPQVAVRVRGDIKPTLKKKAENVEDWLRGALDDLDPGGLHETRFCKFQSGDGLAVAELEMLPDFVPPATDDPDNDYDDLVDDARSQWGLPMRLASPDPHMLYMLEGERPENPPVVIKVTNRPLVDVQNNWTGQGFQLKVAEDGKSVEKRSFILGGGMAPVTTPTEYGRVVRIVRIATNDWIYDCVLPITAPSGSYSNAAFDDMPGTIPSLVLLGRYPNMLGHPPFYLAPARATTDANPANRYYPLALEIIETGALINQTRSMRMAKSIMEVTKPTPYHPDIPRQGNENAAPRNLGKLWKPGILEAYGTFGEIPSPTAEDFDKLEVQITTDRQQFNQGISAAMQSGAMGRGTPAWTTLQYNEEQLMLLGEAQDNRAQMYRRILQDVTRLARDKYGKDGKIYVSTTTTNPRSPDNTVEKIQGLASDDFKVPFNITVNIDTLTQSQRAASTEYGRRLYEEGSISQETYLEEYVGLTDPVQEQARKDREAMLVPMRKAALGMGLQLGANAAFETYGQIILPILQAAGFPQPSAIQEQQQQQEMQDKQQEQAGQPSQAGGAGVLQRGPASPGQGMSIEQPEPSMNGASNGGMG